MPVKDPIHSERTRQRQPGSLRLALGTAQVRESIRAYRATPHADRFSFLWACVILVAAVSASVLLVRGVGLSGTRIETRTVDPPPLSQNASVAEARARLGEPVQVMTLEQVATALEGMQGAGISCSVYQHSDGFTLVCSGP